MNGADGDQLEAGIEARRREDEEPVERQDRLSPVEPGDGKAQAGLLRQGVGNADVRRNGCVHGGRGVAGKGIISSWDGGVDAPAGNGGVDEAAGQRNVGVVVTISIGKGCEGLGTTRQKLMAPGSCEWNRHGGANHPSGGEGPKAWQGGGARCCRDWARRAGIRCRL